MYFKMLIRTVFTVSILIILDRALKLLAVNYNGFFVIGNKEFGASFGMVKNFGIALSINLPLMIAVMFSAFILAYLSWMLYSRRKFMPKIQVIIFELIIAGGLSNMFDRLIYGYVVDYWSIFLFKKSVSVIKLITSFCCILLFHRRISSFDNIGNFFSSSFGDNFW